MSESSRKNHARTFDALPCLGSTMDALATDLFQNTYLSQAVGPRCHNRDESAFRTMTAFYRAVLKASEDRNVRHAPAEFTYGPQAGDFVVVVYAAPRGATAEPVVRGIEFRR